MKYIRLGCSLLLLSAFVLMTACGGGTGGDNSNPQTVSGVAATGAPIKGTVVLKDSNGVQLGPVNTDDDGNYSFEVSQLTPPFILKAVGVSGNQNYTLYSVATGSGNAHITPFSNLALQLATGTDSSAVFGADGSKPDIANINEAKLKAALIKIKNLLSPILTEYGVTDFDPITGDYSAIPGNKLDAMLDVIGINSDNSMLKITNKLDGSVIVAGSLANFGELTIDRAKCPDKSTLTDIKDIADRLVVLCSAMNKSKSLNVQDLEDLFIVDPAYGTSNGHTRAEDMASIVTIFGTNGTNTNGKLKSLRNVRLVSDQTSNYSERGVNKVYLISYDFIFANGNIVHGNNTTWAKDAVTGQWKFIGDPLNLTIGSNYGAVGFSDSGNYGYTLTFQNLEPISPITYELPVMTIEAPLSSDRSSSYHEGGIYFYDTQAPGTTDMN